MTQTDTSERLPEPPVSHGALLIVGPDLLTSTGVSLDGCTVQGEFADSGVFARLHEALYLPDGITIRSIFLDIPRFLCWQVIIEGDDLPEARPGELYQQVEAIYRRDGVRIILEEIRPYVPMQGVDYDPVHFSSAGYAGIPRQMRRARDELACVKYIVHQIALARKRTHKHEEAMQRQQYDGAWLVLNMALDEIECWCNDYLAQWELVQQTSINTKTFTADELDAIRAGIERDEA